MNIISDIVLSQLYNGKLQKAVLLQGNCIGYPISVKNREIGKHLALKQLLPSWWQSRTLLQGVQASFNVWRLVFLSSPNEGLIVDNHNKPAWGLFIQYLPLFQMLLSLCHMFSNEICSTGTTYPTGKLNLKTVLKGKCSLINKKNIVPLQGECSCEMVLTKSLMYTFYSLSCLCLVPFLWESYWTRSF